MTQDDITTMAREAGFQTWESKSPYSERKVLVQPFGLYCNEELERFAALVAAKEREECTKLLEQQHTWITNIAASALIRARGTP